MIYLFIYFPPFLPHTEPVLAETVPVVFVEPDGTEKEVQAEIGHNLLETAHNNNIELEGMIIRTQHLFQKTTTITTPLSSPIFFSFSFSLFHFIVKKKCRSMWR